MYSVGADGLLVHNVCHANSLNSMLTNHGYVIYNRITNQLYKVGISSTKLTGGNSPRALEQLAAIAAQHGVKAADVVHDVVARIWQVARRHSIGSLALLVSCEN